MDVSYLREQLPGSRLFQDFVMGGKLIVVKLGASIFRRFSIVFFALEGNEEIW